jgi:hypothetical protein
MKTPLTLILPFLTLCIFSCDSEDSKPKIEEKEDLSQKTLFVPYYNPEIKYQGRIDSLSSKAVKLFWSSSSVTLNFEGNSIQALMQDENYDTFYTVAVDDNEPFTMQPDSLENYITLADNLGAGSHRVELHRNSEWTRGTTIFKGFEIKGNPKVLPRNIQSTRKIEFYGDSVTAGASVNDTSGEDSPNGSLTDSYKSYTSITARHFNAEQSSICRGGIGLMVSWFEQIMPELYDKHNPFEENSSWNFSNYQPDIVVVNIGQNDSWIVNLEGHPRFMDAFGTTPPTHEFIVNSYKTFISQLREKYPNANIICMLGNMDVTYTDLWPGYVTQAVQELNDAKIFAHFVPFKGTGGHPSVAEHHLMAESLIGFIETNISW